MRRSGLFRGAARFLVGLAWAALSVPTGLQAGTPSPGVDDRVGGIAALRAGLEGLLRTATGSWRASRWSVMAVSLDRGDTLFAAGHDEGLAPASNLKLITAAAAIERLGPDFRYQTFLLGTGPVTAGRLEGDVVLFGTGDPGISSRFHGSAVSVFNALADTLLALGIRVVGGDVVGDGSYFTGPLLGEGWNPADLNDWFAAPSSALSFNENVFSLRVRGSGPPGTLAQILTFPDHAAVPVVNEARVGGGGALVIRRDHPLEPIAVSGSVAGGGREVWRQMTVQDPALFSASVLRGVLEARGIQVLGGVRAVHEPDGSAVTGRRIWAPAVGSPAGPRVLARHVSPPLRDYLEVVNKRSHNLLSDQVLRTLGRILEGDGSFEGGARAVRRFLAANVGIDTSRVVIQDGSGLSSLNQVSAADFVALLSYMASDGDWEAFWASLPEAGNPRELRRMSQTPAAGNLRAKTGTIDNVSALSGMVRAGDGERIAFSIIANRVPSTAAAKRVEDRIGALLASFTRPAGDSPVVVAQAPGEAPGGAPPATGEAAAPDDGRRHQVRSGENLSVIARRYGVPLATLIAANPGLEPRRMRPGDWVAIPVPAPAESGG